MRKLISHKHKNLYNTSNASYYNDNTTKSSIEINYHCMICENNHNDNSYSVCSSKMKKASFNLISSFMATIFI